MKRIVFLIICLFTISVSAQEVTQQNLEGHWKAVAIDLYGNYIDVESQTVTLSEEFSKGDDKAKEVVKQLFLERTAGLGDMELFVKGDMLGIGTGGEILEEEAYVLEGKESRDYLTSYLLDEGDPKEIEIKEGMLHLVIDDGEDGKIVLLLKKQGL